ncbi:MAG: hypothetical protein ACTJG9_08730 [Alcaligenes aquatilis]
MDKSTLKQCLKASPVSIVTRTRADTTLTLTHAQYRVLADLCKEHAGKPLNLASVDDMEGDWGSVHYFALPTIDDATRFDQKYRERAYIYLSNRIDTAPLREAGRHRPECDWSKLSNSELFHFVVWHEIGHIRDNFHPAQFMFRSDLGPEAMQASKKAGYINEVLADRFAWERVRPGQSMPLTKAGQRNADQIESDIEEISRHFTRAKYPHTPLEAGQYRHVPAYMLSSERKAAYVGPDVHAELLKREIAHYSDYFEKHGCHMQGVTL